MSAVFSLQNLTAISANLAQPAEQALDVSEFSRLTVQVRKPVLATTGLLTLQQSLTRDEDGFEDTTITFDLGSGGSSPETKVLEDPLPFIRWKTTSMSGTARFMIGGIGRGT